MHHKVFNLADEFNKILTNIGTGVANKIPNASNLIDSCITKVNTSIEYQPLSNYFFPREINRHQGHYGLFLLSQKYFSKLYEALKYYLTLQLSKQNFPDDLKILKVYFDI